MSNLQCLASRIATVAAASELSTLASFLHGLVAVRYTVPEGRGRLGEALVSCGWIVLFGGLLACSGHREDSARLVEGRPVAGSGEVEASAAPSRSVARPGPREGASAEALHEVAPRRPAAVAPERLLREAGPAPVRESPVPERSDEQELQEEAERQSDVARTLATTHHAVYVLDDLHFASGSARLSAEVASRLDRLAERLQLGDLDYRLEIRGHTDSEGPDAYNLRLGARRAEAVRDHLHRSGGIPLERLVIASLGERLPLSETSSLNRRVTVRVLEPRPPIH